MVFDSRMNAILCWLHQIMEIKKQTAVKRNYSTADGNGSTSRGSSPCSWASPRRRSQPLWRCICTRNFTSCASLCSFVVDCLYKVFSIRKYSSCESSGKFEVGAITWYPLLLYFHCFPMYNQSRLLPFSQIVFKRWKTVVAGRIRAKFSEGKKKCRNFALNNNSCPLHMAFFVLKNIFREFSNIFFNRWKK